jgi:beta-lactamase regulating signal transducer with metallopeptidase domain
MTPMLDGMLFDHASLYAGLGAAVAAASVATLAIVVARAARGRPAPLRYGLLLAALVVLGIVPAVAAVSRLGGWGAVRVSPVTVDRPLTPRSFAVTAAVPRPASVPAVALSTEAQRPDRVAEPAMVPMRAPAFREAASCLLWVWIGGFVGCVAFVIRDLVRLQRLRQSLVPCPSEAAVGLLGEAARSVGLTQPPRLFESAAVPVPVVIGPAQPAVVLPAGMAISLEPEKLSAVLLHEAAHVVHGDLWVGLLQHAVAAVFWWCPPVHRLNRRLAEVREEICDDYVVTAQGDGFQLAEVLVEMAAGLRAKRQRLAIGTLGAIDEKPALEGRVERLVDLGGKAIPMTRMNRMAVAAAGAFGAVALAIVVATTIHAADELPAAQPRAITTDKDVVAAETDGAPRAGGAVAWLRLRKSDFQSEADYQRYRETRVGLVKSPAVLESALQQAGVRDLKCIRAESNPLIWLSHNVHAHMSRNEHTNMERNSDWLVISVADVDAEEASTLVENVAQAYVAIEKREVLERRDNLERKYKELMAATRANLDAYNDIIKSLGTADSQEVDSRRSLLLDRLRLLGEQISRLENDKLAVETDVGVAVKLGEKPDPKLEARLEVLREQIARVADQSARVADEAKELGAARSDLIARKEAVERHMKFTDQIGVQLNAAEQDVLKLNQVELLGVTTFGPEGLDRENLGGLMRGTRERQE